MQYIFETIKYFSIHNDATHKIIFNYSRTTTLSLNMVYKLLNGGNFRCSIGDWRDQPRRSDRYSCLLKNEDSKEDYTVYTKLNRNCCIVHIVSLGVFWCTYCWFSCQLVVIILSKLQCTSRNYAYRIYHRPCEQSPRRYLFDPVFQQQSSIFHLFFFSFSYSSIHKQKKELDKIDFFFV